MPRYFTVEIQDLDGETQMYDFAASSLWSVTAHIAARMDQEGDFYGHKKVDTLNLIINELAVKPLGHFITLN